MCVSCACAPQQAPAHEYRGHCSHVMNVRWAPDESYAVRPYGRALCAASHVPPRPRHPPPPPRSPARHRHRHAGCGSGPAQPLPAPPFLPPPIRLAPSRSGPLARLRSAWAAATGPCSSGAWCGPRCPWRSPCRPPGPRCGRCGLARPRLAAQHRGSQLPLPSCLRSSHISHPRSTRHRVCSPCSAHHVAPCGAARARGRALTWPHVCPLVVPRWTTRGWCGPRHRGRGPREGRRPGARQLRAGG